MVAVKREGGRQRLDLLGSNIEIVRDEWGDGLWVIATTSPKLPHPYLEGWLCEPLRILCGQMIYPRVVARNTGDGRSHISLRRTCSLHSMVGGLRASFDRPDPGSFWTFYKQCLEFLAAHRDEDGNPQFGSNYLSRFHEEVIQAAGSSEWVLALATSSAIEGMCRLAAQATGLPKEFDAKAIGEATKHLKGMPGPERLRDRLVSSLAHMGQPSVRKFLDDLVRRQVIRAEHREAWVSVRNRVAHGRLDGVAKATEDGDTLVLLVELLNALTAHVVAKP